MTSAINSDRSAQQEVRKHPIRGAIWGFFLGLGVAIYLVLFAVIAFGDWIPFGLCIAAGIALGIVWALFAPAKQPKGAQPSSAVAAVPEEDDLGVMPADPKIDRLSSPPPPPTD